MMIRTSPTLLFGFLIAALSCESDPPAIDGKVVTEKAALDAQAVMHESGLALGFAVADDGTVAKLMGASANSMPAAAPSMPVPPTSMLRAMVGPTLTAQMTGVQLPSMLTTEERFDEAGQQVARLMRERLFVDGNLEGSAGGVATYLLHADPTCRPLPQDSDPPGTVPAIDQKCADDFAKVPVRIAVSADGDGARMTVLIGEGRLELVVAIVHSDELAIEIDLPKAKAATDLLEQRLGDGTAAGSYDRLAGKVRGFLKKAGARKVTAGWAILQSLDVAPTGGGFVTVAPSDPVVAITSDGVSKTAVLQLGLGATTVATSWDPRGTGVSNEDLHVVIGGLYGKLALDEGAKTVSLVDVGIGQTRATVRGTTIFDLNLNADSMRRFSGKLAVGGDGVSRIELVPRVDLSLAFDYNAVASDLSSPPAVTVGHETYLLGLANQGAPVVIAEARSTASFTGGLRMDAGTLTLGAASVPTQTVTVPAGKCLSTISPAPAGTHALLGTLVVSDCP